MKKIIIFSIAAFFISTESSWSNSDKLTKIYKGKGFSFRYPSDYKIDDNGLINGSYLSSEKKINGVVISKIDKGSNLFWASISLEKNMLPTNTKCSALSVEPILGLEALGPESSDNPIKSVKDGNKSYSTISIGDAAMHQSISEEIWAIEDTNPCIIIRYIISSTNAQVYDPPLREFDKESLRQTFDEIRRSVTLSQ